MGGATHLYVKEGGQVATVETLGRRNVQQEATVNGQEATIKAARTDIVNAKTAETRTEVLIELFIDPAPPRAIGGLKVSSGGLAFGKACRGQLHSSVPQYICLE